MFSSAVFISVLLNKKKKKYSYKPNFDSSKITNFAVV